MNWTEGYIAEIDYTVGYFPELNPLRTRFALTSRGVQSRDISRPTYLELGFGHGVPFAIHAAVCPGEFWGTDFNPGQAAGAQDLIAASGADAKAFDVSFTELAERSDLPEFDVIALHGIWSWVSPENRRVIVDIARRKLKPGGVFYVSYNVAPGWTPLVPVRDLLQIHAARAGNEGDGIVARLDAALDFAEKLAESGSLYFKQNPTAIERLKKMRDRNRKYVVHELSNAEWHPMPFAQLVEELGPGKLTFGATATLTEQFNGLHLSAEGQAIVAGIADLVLRETARDFLENAQFRRDYFLRGPRSLPSLVQTERMRKFRFVLGIDPKRFTFEIKGSLGTAKLQESIYAPVLDALGAEGARIKTLHEVEELVLPRGVSLAQAVQALTLMIAKNAVHLAQDDADIEWARPRAAALNLHLLDRARTNADINFLASPVSGSGIPVGRLDQLFLLARCQGKQSRAEWVEQSWQILSSQGQRVQKDGKRIEPEDENRVELGKIVEEFEAERLPVFLRLGLV